MFRIEAFPENDPDPQYFGSRDITFQDPAIIDSDYQVNLVSVMSQEPDYNGLINRNIRLAVTAIDMAMPYIVIERILRIKVDGTDLLQVEFKMNGCLDVWEVSYSVNDVT